MATAIVYKSVHHGNTKKLVDAIAASCPDVSVFDANDRLFDPTKYDRIGFASGIYMGKMHKSILKALDGMQGSGKKAFALFTCGDKNGGKYGAKFLNALREKGFETCGSYWCLGHDSFGPLKLMGGVHKERPNTEDIRGAVEFYTKL
ncbi:MAG TPA: flavodoxin domain-containing protein [Clostridia bacterium]|nr:flavodoxin domain-containing protein [Clostridia bacterium]